MAKSWEEIKKEREEKVRSFSNPVQNNANKLRSEGFLVANPNPQQRKWEDIRKERGYVEPEPPPTDYWKEQPLRVLGKNINAGINMLPRGMVGVADATIGSLGIKPVNKFLDSYKDYYKKADEELAMLNKGHEFAGGVAQGIGQAIPTMALALMNPATAVGSAVPTTAKGTQLVANAASLANPTTLNAARAVLSSLKSNPTLYSSMVTSVGNQYLQGLNEGASREEAIKSAIIGGVPSALIEVSGGIENLTNIMANKTKGLVGVALQAAIEEGFEEIMQYPIENIGQKVAYDKDMPLFSMKEQAVINPKEMMFSGAVGATVGGLMGGGAAGVNTALYKNYSKQLDAMYKNTIDNLPEDSPILERVRQLQDDNVNIDDNTKLWVINSAREGGMKFESETDKLLQKDRQKETFFSNENKVQDQLIEQGKNIVKTQNMASQAINPVLSMFNIQNIENAREVKQNVYEFYKNSIISDSNTSKPILNKSSGMNVEVSRATINQTFQADDKYAQNQDNEIKIAAMGNLVDLIQNGEFTVVDNSDTPSSKVKYAEIKGTVNFNDIPYEITMDIRRTDNGRKLFVHSLSTNYQQVSGKKSGVVYNGVDERVRQQYPKVYDILDRIGKATNTKFKFVDTIYDPTGQIPGFANGQYDPTTDSIEIALDTFNPFMVVAKHEITHMLEKENPKLYREYKDYVLSAMKENGTYDVQYERMAELYKSRGLEVDKNAIEDELVADATELFLTDEKAINDLVAENKTLGQKILDILRRLIEKIEDILKVSGFTEGWLNTEQLRQAERLWVNALSSVADGDVKYSLKDDELIFYRGTVPGETKRIDEPFTAAKGKTFVARKEKSALLYGKRIEKIKAKPGAKIIYENTKEFNKLIGKMKPNQSYIEFVNSAVVKAEKLGYDIISFERDSDIGTVILNEDAVIRNYKEQKYSLKDDGSKEYTVNEIENMILQNHEEYNNNKEALKLAAEAIKDLQKVKFSISSTGRKVDWDRAGIRTIADGISREFINKGYVELKGRKVNSLEELAVIGQIFRDPRFETFRIFYTKNNKIVAHEGISSRIPGVSSAFLNTPKRSEYSSEYEYQTARKDFIKTRYDDMKDRMKRLKADGYYLLHNHPSGNPNASKADVYLTKGFMDNVEGFKGHVIINSNKYGWLEMGEYSYSIHVEDMAQQQIELFLKPTIEHPLLNVSINGADKAASIAKSLQLSKDKTAIVYTDVKGVIRGIEEIPNGMFNDRISIRGFLRNRGRHFGSGWAFLSTTSQDIFDKSADLVKEKYLMDSILLTGSDNYYSHRADTGIEQDDDYEWAGIRSDELESARVNEENEVFYTPQGVEIIKNPTNKQIEQLRADFRKEYPSLAKQGEPPTRRTYDIKVIKYDEKIEGDRLKKVNSVKGVKFSLKDSQGRTLTQEQAEYFKDSKVRDDKGNLLALYHGTFNEFYTFTKGDIGYHFGTKKAAEDRIKTRRGVTADYDNSETYMMPVYLNISNPMTLPDTGAWRPIDIIKALEVEADYNNSPLTKKELQTELNRYFDAIDDKGFNKATSEWYENFKNRLITEHGIDGIKYKNKFEDKGEYSYIAFSPEQIKSVDNLEPTYNEDIRYSLRTKEPPKKTIKAYKLLRIDRKTGKLYPLFVGANEETPTGIWLDADEGEMTTDKKTGTQKVKSKLGNLAYRPGWHLGDIPLATHIGVKGDSGKIEFMNPDHVWAEVDVAADFNYQEEANKNGINPKTGKMNRANAYIKRIPVDGFYRYKTNPNMTGEWIITGAIKINRVLSDSEAAAIVRKAGYEPLPRAGTDVKYQLRDNKSVKDIEKLQNTVTRLKEQFKLTKGVKLDEKAVRKFAKSLLKDYGSKYSSTELEAKLYNVYMGMVNGTMEYDEAQIIITEVARDIIENASVLNDAMYKQYSELRNTMRNTAISIDDRYKGDFDAVGGWNDFRKRNFGRMNITSDGMSIDKLYQELSDSYPELFLEDVANPADQLMLISDVLDSLVPIYENPYNRELNEAVEYLALEIFDGMTSVPEAKPTFADRKKAEKQKAVKAEKDKSKARVEALKNKNVEDIAWLKYQNKEKLAEVLQKEKAKRDEAVVKVKKQYQDKAYKTWWRNKLNENDIKSHYQEMIKELRLRRDEKLEQQKTKYKERISGIYEDRKIRQAKDRIRTMAKKLDKMLRSPTQKQHIPKALDKTIAELLTMLDFTTDRQKETTQIKLRDLRAEYEKIAKVSDEEGLSTTADPYIVEALEMLHNKRIAEMNLQEIELLRDIVGYFENMVRTYNKAFLGDKWIDVSTKAEGIIKDLETDTPMNESAYGGILYFKDMMNWGMLTPQMFFERMGNTFNSLYDDFRAALDVKINNTKIAQDYMKDLLKDSKDKIKDWTGKKAEIKTIKLDSGKTIELTQAQLMSFYLLMKREQARGHIFGLGIKAAPIVAVDKKGMKYVKKQFEPVKITLDDATKMIAMLSKEQRRIADGIGKFMNTYSKQWVNEATLQNYGYELAKEENYFPIKVDRDFLKSDFDNTNLDPTFTSMGFLKATIKGAGNAIILEDVFDVFTEHADKAATYNAFVGITESTKKIVNYKTQDNSIKQAMNKKFGIQAFNYLKKFMVDLQGGIRTESGSPVVTGLIRNAKRAVLGLNLRTIIQQPTAIVRASALIDIDYLIKGVAMKSDKAEMLEKSPIARWKSWGYFNLDTGRSMKDIILDSVPLLDKQYQGMQIADDITWTKIWNAVKLEIEDNEPGLKVGSAEYFDAVNYRFNEIIDRTQVVDTVMHRSDAMRQSDSSWKILTAFMSEPTKSYNLLLNAVEKYNANKSAENKKVLLRTFSAWTATMLVNTLVISMLDMWRRKEDDKETFKDKWIDNILNDVTGYVPIVRDIYSLFEGYSVKRMEYNGIERIVRAINRSKKYIEEMAEDKKHSYPLRLITKDWIESVAYVFGVGAINVSKDLEALLRNYTRWIDDEGVVNDIYKFMFKK